MSCNCGSETTNIGTMTLRCIKAGGCEFKPWGYIAAGAEFPVMPSSQACLLLTTWPDAVERVENSLEPIN